MKNTIAVAAIQYNIHWESRDHNLKLLDGLFQEVPEQTDIIVLPEMFATGFTMNASKLAEPMHGPIVEWMIEKASLMEAAVCGSVIIDDDGKYYNRFIWATAAGVGAIYDKRHLFVLSGENKYYSAGKQRVLIEYEGWRIMPQVCYDLRFPVWSRNDLDYDLLLYVSNWPSYRTYAWSSLMIARAIENQSYLVGVNRIGEDDHGNPFPGCSAIIDFAGKEIMRVGDGQHILFAELDKKDMQAFRKKYAFLEDRDSFTVT